MIKFNNDADDDVIDDDVDDNNDANNDIICIASWRKLQKLGLI